MKNMREVKKMKENGITLVALVITIIILLVLAGVSIATLTNTGIFEKAKEAKEKTREAEENQAKTLSEYEKAIDINSENTLVYKVNNGTIKIGDYVSYEPDTVTSTDEQYKTLISNLKTYSGNTDNTEARITQEKLKWRVLDIKDGQVRLISDEPTSTNLSLRSYNGYNNAVKLLDDTCNTLYSNSKLANKVQNLKIEDIQDKMVETELSSSYGKMYEIENKYIPDILLNEKDQIVDEEKGTELNISEQKELINQTEKKQAKILKIKSTHWAKKMKDTDFENSKYYELFINNGNNYNKYWLSSRCISYYLGTAFYIISGVGSGEIKQDALYSSKDTTDYFTRALRPCVTLNSNVQLDTTNSGDGSIAEQAYVIK